MVGWESSDKAKGCSLVESLVRTQAWVVGQVPGWGVYKRQPIFLLY